MMTDLVNVTDALKDASVAAIRRTMAIEEHLRDEYQRQRDQDAQIAALVAKVDLLVQILGAGRAFAVPATTNDPED